MPANSTRPQKTFLDAVRSGVLVVDGAMGTQLYERGVLHNASFDELNVSRPELVTKVHHDYLRAGAQVIESNTFGANALRLEKFGMKTRVRELNLAGVRVAREAAAGQAYVLGAMGPTGYFLGGARESSAGDHATVRAVYVEQARALVEAGVDGILVETMRQTSELRLAVEAAVEVSEGRVPVVASASFAIETGLMAEGTTPAEVARLAKEWGASIAGVNCSDGPMGVLAAVEQMIASGLPIIASPNAGLPRVIDERTIYVSTPEYFGVYAQRMFRIGVRLMGGCCGTTHEHIRRIAASARMMAGFAGDLAARSEEADRGEAWSEGGQGPAPVIEPPQPPGAIDAKPLSERSGLAAKIAEGKFVVSVEVSPPAGLDPSRAIAAAKSLKAGGVDVINIADGARAQARMSNLALAVRVQREAEIETILHVCGRDRNLLGTIAHLLGAHDLGVRNLVIITGDPPKMGDYPDATAVYDLDSVGMLKLASRLNHGVDPGGKPLLATTSFLLATGVEPATLNYERELERLREKKAAGAEVVMTQPVYAPEVLDRFLADVAPLGMPVLVGLLPLASYRNAEFLHNEVPGMQVPDDVRERMRKAGSGPSARKEGVAIAREMLASVRGRVAGAYVMPPLERYELALEVVDGFLDR
jgi:methionine synthase I (cobalamin-dependent)/5,10-methylenetetrahydrofolate reductase